MSASESENERKANLFREQGRIAAETEARLAADPAVQAWLLQCLGNGKGLLQTYAEQKANYLTNGPSWLKQEQFLAGWPRRQAYRMLWQIQQKKLFDLQCQWRACQIELAEVTDGREFAEWGKAIQQCPVLDPISADDLELFLNYVNSDSCPDLAAGAITGHDWQDYEGFRSWVMLEEAGSGSPGHDMVRDDLPNALADSLGHLFNMFYRYPDWYAYYDLYRGTGQLLRLPQVRFVEEEIPAPEPAAGDSAAVPTPPAAAPESSTEPPLRHLNARDLPLTETLLRHFEQPELLRHMRVMEYEPEEDPLTEAARSTYDLLSEITQPVPMPAGPDWRQCLLDAYLAHQRRLIGRALRLEYADYCQREAAGQPHPLPE